MKLVSSCILVLLLVAITAAVMACGDEDADTTPTPSANGDTNDTAAGGAASDTAAVEMKDISFVPDEVTVKVNTTVRWVNSDPVTHTVTDDQDLFDSGVIDSDAVFEHLYDEPGTYDYTCTIHPTTMTGTVIVEE